jgi:hypothetical protein
MQIRKLTFSLLILAAIGYAVQARAKVIEDSSGSLKTLTSIGDALDSADHHPVHILYVHGINQIGAGDSALLRESICTRLKLCSVSDWKKAGVEFADKGEFADGVNPPTLAYLGSPVWNNEDEWHAAAPFVVHWVVQLRHHPAALEVDEINWWPLLMALKCRGVLAPESYLAGPDHHLLKVCSQRSAQDPSGLARFYPWITPDQAAKLAAIHPRGMLINRTLKSNLVDWGLGDVMLAVGPMGGLMRDGIRQLMAKSAAFDPNQALGSTGSAAPSQASGSGTYNWRALLSHDNAMDQEFIGVTHSLGSYLLFNTLTQESADAVPQQYSAAEAKRLAAEETAMRYIFERMSLVYFFANQLQMLEITNLENVPAATASAFQPRGLDVPPAPVTRAANFRSLVDHWSQMQSSFQIAVHPSDSAAREKLQVVAWSDPSDVITFRVPRIGSVDVVNLYVQNSAHWFRLFESPTNAHADYACNKAVLRTMFENTDHRNATR